MTPILRSPPFPGVATGVAAVSGGGDPMPSAPPIDLLALIREARVGGDFWLPPHRGEKPTALLHPRSAADEATMRAALDREAAAAPLVVQTDRVDPWSLLESALVVHAHGDDEIVALAKIAGIPCVVHSPGRYDGDETTIAGSLAAVAWRNPFTGEAAPIERVVAILADWRRSIDANHGIAVACGIARWKRREIAQFLWAPRPFAFARGDDAAIRRAQHTGGGIAIWPSRVPASFSEHAQARGTATTRIEDGFIRSVGLGSALFPPFSVSLDASGIYYDPGRASDLETILETAPMSPDLLARAEALRVAIVAAGIGKYGGGGASTLPDRDPARRLVLVAGQVEDDLSVKLGGGDVAGNRDLLARARRLEPDAEIWFRPHPDVDAGHRTGAIPDADALRNADRVVRGGSMAALLDRVDGVHVLTSLTGFEALLRGCAVTVHGAPFFAGWGLTRDRGPVPARRTRQLDLAGLVAGTLILYPRYLDPVTGLPCPPEILIERLAGQWEARHTWLTRLRAIQGRFMRGRR